jgi:hypothetical protein
MPQKRRLLDDLQAANVRVAVQFYSQRLTGKLVARDVGWHAAGVNVDRVSSRWLDNGHAVIGDGPPEVAGRGAFPDAARSAGGLVFSGERVGTMEAKIMDLALQIPDDLARRLGAGGEELSRRALEGFALEEYKSGRITAAEIRRLLGFSARYELDGFLKAHKVWADIGIEDLQQDLRDLESLGL